MPYVKSYWVDIENESGEKQGGGYIVPQYFDVSSELSAAGTFEFAVSPYSSNYSAISVNRYAVCRYADENGDTQEFGGGRISSISRKTDEAGLVSVIISGMNTIGQLRDKIVGELQIGDDTGGDDDAPDQIMALAPAGWSVTGGTTDDDVYVRFDGQTVLGALVSVSDVTGEHFRLGSGRDIEWLGKSSAFLPSGVRAFDNIPQPLNDNADTVVIKNITQELDAHDLVTRVYPRGSGNGSAILKLESLTETPPTGYTANASEGWVQNDDAVTEYGIIEKSLDFKNISPLSNSAADRAQASNQLMRATVEYLERWKDAQEFYSVKIGKIDKPLEIGTTIQVLYNPIAEQEQFTRLLESGDNRLLENGDDRLLG